MGETRDIPQEEINRAETQMSEAERQKSIDREFERVQKELEQGEKMPVDLAYENLERLVPEVGALKGIDQKSDFHTLTIDEHTKEAMTDLRTDEFVAGLSKEKRDLIFLAMGLHDIGKVVDGERGRQKKGDKFQYVGHDKAGAELVLKIMDKFDVSSDEAKFIEKLVELHMEALNLVNAFKNNHEPKGKELKAYDTFITRAEEMPGDLDENLEIILAVGGADSNASINQQTRAQNQELFKKVEGQASVIEELKKAMPAIKEAVIARRGGDQTAGIILESGEYKYKKPEKEKKAEIPPELKKLGRVLRDKTKDVAEVYDMLKDKKDNERALQGIINGLLKRKIGLNDEQIEAVINSLRE